MSKSVAGATGSKTLSGGRCSEKDIVREGQDYGALDAGNDQYIFFLPGCSLLISLIRQPERRAPNRQCPTASVLFLTVLSASGSCLQQYGDLHSYLVTALFVYQENYTFSHCGSISIVFCAA